MSLHDLTPSIGRTEPALAAFLIEFLGAWPQSSGLTIVGSPLREEPGWDGMVRKIMGVGAASQAVISVPPAQESVVRKRVRTWADIPANLPAAVDRPGGQVFFGTFRWTLTPTDLPDAGVWIDATDARVPEWLRPFGGEVLITFIDGVYAAGVGIKRHNPAGMELAVGTEEGHRGQGLASRLVAQAARRVLAAGAVPIYLHDPANIASDRTAQAAGFPDLGWKILGVLGGGEQPS